MKKNDDLVTKKYLDKKLKVFRSELREELVEFKDNVRAGVREDIYQMKDELAGLIKSSQEEKDVHNFSHARINEELDDHDRRISQLAAA